MTLGITVGIINNRHINPLLMSMVNGFNAC